MVFFFLREEACVEKCIHLFASLQYPPAPLTTTGVVLLSRICVQQLRDGGATTLSHCDAS